MRLAAQKREGELRPPGNSYFARHTTVHTRITYKPETTAKRRRKGKNGWCACSSFVCEFLLLLRRRRRKRRRRWRRRRWRPSNRKRKESAVRKDGEEGLSRERERERRVSSAAVK